MAAVRSLLKPLTESLSVERISLLSVCRTVCSDSKNTNREGSLKQEITRQETHHLLGRYMLPVLAVDFTSLVAYEWRHWKVTFAAAFNCGEICEYSPPNMRQIRVAVVSCSGTRRACTLPNRFVTQMIRSAKWRFCSEK